MITAKRDFINYVTGYTIAAISFTGALFLILQYFYSKKIEKSVTGMYICTVRFDIFNLIHSP